MGFSMNRLRWTLSVAATVLAWGCGSSFRLRVDAPTGGSLRVVEGPFAPARVMRIPFHAEFAPHGDIPYRVEMDIPADSAPRVGGTQSVRLYGYLYVYPGSELIRPGTVVRLGLSDAQIRELVTGHSSEICQYIRDATRQSNSNNASVSGCPSVGSGARIVLRSVPF